MSGYERPVTIESEEACEIAWLPDGVLCMYDRAVGLEGFMCSCALCRGVLCDI